MVATAKATWGSSPGGLPGGSLQGEALVGYPRNEDWDYLLDALSRKARRAAQLLAGVMPQDIERAFAASGRRNATAQGVTVQTGMLPPQARRTWSYAEDMDPELVVITPVLEGELGVDEAGLCRWRPIPTIPMPTTSSPPSP